MEMATYAGGHTSGPKTLEGISIKLTDDQKNAIQEFWKDKGSVGTVEIQVEVVGDKISPASIQVGTAK
jgi:F0F1-type ATP synthase delta subunit